jgi:uncharacterized protein YbaR (Trm112 family)
MSYVICKKCGFRIKAPFKCIFEYPLLFVAKCPKCKHTDLYHRLEVVEEDKELCREAVKRSEERTKPLDELMVYFMYIKPLLQIQNELFNTLQKRLIAIQELKARGKCK